MTSFLERADDVNSERPKHDDALAEANHRIANSLALVSGMLRVEARRISNRSGTMDRREVGSLLREMGSKVDAVGRLHALLSRSPGLKVVNLADHLRDVCTSLVSSLARAGSFEVSLEFATSCCVPMDKVIPLTLIVVELITNAVKYAHPAGAPGRIVIGAAKTSEGVLTLDIADDGVGLPDGLDAATDGDIGLRLVRSLAAQLGATVEFTSSSLGLHVRLRLAAPVDRPFEVDRPCARTHGARRATGHPSRAIATPEQPS